MKKYLLLITIAMGMVAFGQRHPGAAPNREAKMEQIKANKIAFITQKVQLTPKEAQAFWPVYNEYSDKLEEVSTKQKSIKKSMRSLAELTDAQINEKMNKHLQLRRREVEIQSNYKDRFIKIIGVRKTAKLVKAEMEFKRELLKRLKGHQGPPGHRP